MRYYKNIELSRRFGIGGNTISRWIQNSIDGKNTLEIVEKKQLTNDKPIFRIISNAHNEKELLKLFQDGRSKTKVSLKKEVNINIDTLKIFSTKQISELINALEDKHIPLKFTYMNGGAEMWDEYIQESRKSGEHPTTKRTEQLLDSLYNNMDLINPENKKINFFDIGCGNFLPVQNYINTLNKKKMLNKYIAIDISQEMLEIAETQALKILRPDQIVKVQRDFEIENFSDYANPFRDNDTINIVAFIGSTIGNYTDQRTILTHLRESLIKDDLLIITNRLDTENAKTKFNNILEKNERRLWIPAMLGIDTGEVQFHSIYDEKKDARVIAMKLDKDYSFTFTFPDSNAERKIYLYASDQIILWHHKMTSIEDIPMQFKRAGLEQILFLKTVEDNYGMFVTKKKPYADRI